jgi:hypothetical protein
VLEVVRGQAVRLRLKVRLAGGVVPSSDPTTVVIRVTDPTATVDYTLAAAQVQIDTTTNLHGDYYYDLTTAALADSKLGIWHVAGITTGTPASADVNVFRLISEVTG